jgi:hypothetical protein
MDDVTRILSAIEQGRGKGEAIRSQNYLLTVLTPFLTPAPVAPPSFQSPGDAEAIPRGRWLLWHHLGRFPTEVKSNLLQTQKTPNFVDFPGYPAADAPDQGRDGALLIAFAS